MKPWEEGVNHQKVEKKKKMIQKMKMAVVEGGAAGRKRLLWTKARIKVKATLYLVLRKKEREGLLGSVTGKTIPTRNEWLLKN